MVTLIESTVSVTTRHSDSAPIASEAAMALVSRDEATGARRLTKPAEPGDPIMVQILQDADESPATSPNLAAIAGIIAAIPGSKMAKLPQ